ncbi:MlaD family protein [Mycobacterium sp. ACS4331]|uniref:MCE family protein n=1 Tax=Mycobacterium sp. ACS4331 TaxID=1834121 RepID=UPI0008003260|nr:MlaD family protein [Mycobacterium sp. ACS4331]OBF24889.1 virulence factor Mce [Mycobacterium sp. ACS4331]
MLTRLVRIQLAVFGVASLVGLAIMASTYLQIPTLLGVGRVTVTLQLPAGGGLYRFSNVTYRGVEIGQVTSISLTESGAKATLSLDRSPRIPADLDAEVRSVSAVGEQYVDLRPRAAAPPYLRDGDVIPADRVTIPQRVGPMLDQVSALIGSIPKDRLNLLTEESFRAFNGSGYDLGSLLDSSKTITSDAFAAADQTATLIEDSVPLLDAQAETIGSIRDWTRSLADVTDQLVSDEPDIRTILQTGPGAIQEAHRLLDQVKPTLPVLLANLTSLGQVGVVYHNSLRQLLILLPPYTASTQSFALQQNNPTGLPQSAFAMAMSDPPACTVGFLPPSAWRSPADTTTIDTPDGLYCKLPQDSPISVRGARNYPCQEVPGKRAPTVEMCRSERPFTPLAQRQHALGPYPIDPNLIAQGVPLDDRVDGERNLQGPVQGTPLPPGIPVPPGPPAAAGAPGVAIAQYDPGSGRFMTPGGEVLTQTDLGAGGPARTWQDLLTPG